jgi:hypothetical protein
MSDDTFKDVTTSTAAQILKVSEEAVAELLAAGLLAAGDRPGTVARKNVTQLCSLRKVRRKA